MDFSVSGLTEEIDTGMLEKNEEQLLSELLEEDDMESTPCETEVTEPDNEPKQKSVDNSKTEQLLQDLKQQFNSLEEKFDRKISEDAYKNSLFDKLYDELSSYKKDLYAKLILPFVNETISLLGSYEKLIDKIDSLDRDRLIECVKDVPDDLERLLDDNGVERYADETVKFNPKSQRVIKTVFTGNQDADTTIAEHIRKGYRWNGTILKPEMVAIFKYKEGYQDLAAEIVQGNQESTNDVTPECEGVHQTDISTEIVE